MARVEIKWNKAVTKQTCKLVGPKGQGVQTHQIKECAERCSSHWFDKSSMRFFNSRVADMGYLDGRGGALFTSSEKGPNGVRAYSIRRYDPKRCGIETVGKFQRYGSKAEAEKIAERIANSGNKLK